MAIFHCTFKSEVLKQAAPINVIIPERCVEDIPTIYLLHGLSGNQDDWIRYTAIERYADEKGIAMVMPAVGKSYFSDMKYGQQFYNYVAKELIEYTRRVFKLSHKREKTFIAGLSMGGYGALKIGLSNPDKFAAIASLSGVTDIYYRFSIGGDEKAAKSIWGENYLDCLQSIDNNIYKMTDYIIDNKLPKPWIFQVCGTEDFLYETNLRFKRFIETKDFKYEYHECPGKHTWDIWDHWIPYAIDYFIENMKSNGITL